MKRLVVNEFTLYLTACAGKAAAGLLTRAISTCPSTTGYRRDREQDSSSDYFPQATVPIKMHILEDHATPWAKLYHVGFDPHGKQGAQSIHAKLTQLGLAYTAIKPPQKGVKL